MTCQSTSTGMTTSNTLELHNREHLFTDVSSNLTTWGATDGGNKRGSLPLQNRGEAVSRRSSQFGHLRGQQSNGTSSTTLRRLTSGPIGWRRCESPRSAPAFSDPAKTVRGPVGAQGLISQTLRGLRGPWQGAGA